MKKPQIIFEDEVILILDKPSGWVVDKSKTSGNAPVIEDWLKNKDFPLSKELTKRRGIVHRLDKETSGVLLIAKTEDSLERLQKAFKNREVKKQYLALVHGKIEPSEGMVNAPLGRLPWSREKFGILPGGRNSITSYKTLEYYKRNQDLYTLVILKPKTGRTHQIRIHLKYLNHPVVSDPLYAGRKQSKQDRLWCKRLFLHAKHIGFAHPKTGKFVEFESKLPVELTLVLNKLSGV